MKYIALLRGINVGGHNKLPMAALRAQLEEGGFGDVQTYIQSGNIVFEAEGFVEKFALKIAGIIETNQGFRPQIMVLDKEHYKTCIRGNPFPLTVETGNLAHCFFLNEPAAKADLEKIESLAAPTEQWHLTEHAFYLFAPDGVARSKLMAGAEKALGVSTTARNWRTAMKLDEMLK